MGLYQIACPSCGKEHMWFSGTQDQRCEACMTQVPQQVPINSYPDEVALKWKQERDDALLEIERLQKEVDLWRWLP